MHAPRLLWSLAFTALAAACHTPTTRPNVSPRGTAPTAADAARHCRALHVAPAFRWGELLPAVTRAGSAAEQHLIRLIEDSPSADGAQATVAVLGRVGAADAVALCRRLVTEQGPLAVEAALALGTLPTSRDDPALTRCLDDAYTDATLKTAAACSLARHGERARAPRWIAAIVRAGTPAGKQDERELGVPRKTRWARERYFIQQTLAALGHQDLLEELDTDAPWPALEALAPEVEARLRSSRR